MIRSVVPILCLLIGLLLPPAAACGEFGGAAVLVPENDPFHRLAADIAGELNGALTTSLEDVLTEHADVVIYVGSPSGLSESTLLAIAREMKKHDWYPIFSIIGGKTEKSARALWDRGLSTTTDKRDIYFGGDHDQTAGVEHAILAHREGGSTQLMPLEKATLQRALAHSRFFYWSRHLSKSKLFWCDVWLELLPVNHRFMLPKERGTTIRRNRRGRCRRP